MKRKRAYKRLSERYRSLDITEYINILMGCGFMDFIEQAERIIDGVMILEDYEGEFICTVSEDTQLKVIKHYYDGKFFGWNVYALIDSDLKLLETYESKREAISVVENIKKELRLGTKRYELPGN